MLDSKDQTPGKFANVKLRRYLGYTRLTHTASRGIDQWTPQAWELNGDTAVMKRTGNRRTLPEQAIKTKHTVYVFSRRFPEIESRLIFETALRHMDLNNGIPASMLRERREFAVLAVPGKLSPEGIDAIRKRHRHMLNYFRIGGDKRLGDAQALEVLFPFAISRSLVQYARDWISRGQKLSMGHTLASIRSMRHRDAESSRPSDYHEFQLASTMRTLLSDSALAGDLSGALAGGTSKKVATLVGTREHDIALHTEMAERITAECVEWFDTELVDTLLEHCEVASESSEYDVIEELRHVVDFLSETATGTARLSAYVQNKFPHSFIHRGFVEVPEALGPIWRRARLKLKVSANIFATLHKADALLDHTRVVAVNKHMHRWLSEVFANRTLDFRAALSDIDFSQSRLVGKGKKAFTRLEGKFQKITPDKQTITEMKEVFAEHQGKIDSFILMVDTINVGVAIGAVMEAAAHDTDMLVDSGLTATGLILSVVGRVLKSEIDAAGPGLTKAAYTGLANLGSAWFAYKNIVAANAAGKVGDTDAQWVMIVGAGAEIGALIMAVSAAFAAEGTVVAAMAGPVGAVLGMIGGVCYLIYEVVKDSELALAVSYSIHGSMATEDLPPPVPWCPVSPAAMRLSHKVSLIGIDYGLRQFTVTTKNRPKDTRLATIFLPCIIVGHIDEHTVFEVEWDLSTRINGKTTELKTTEVWSPFGDLKIGHAHKQRSYASRLQANKKGEMFFDAEVPEGFGAFADPQFSGVVRIRKLFESFGDQYPIPFKRAVELKIFTTMTTHGSQRIRSSSIDP